MFAGGYWGNAGGTGGPVTYIPLGPLTRDETEADLVLEAERALVMEGETDLRLATEKTVGIEDDDDSDNLTV